MKKLFPLFLLMAFFAACSNDDTQPQPDPQPNPQEQNEIILEEGTATDQIINADAATLDKGITFTTKGPWRAEVEEVGTKAATETNWLTLSRYSGDKAGDYTITISIEPNLTGKSRKAVIRIICGSTTITITIEQSAEKETDPKTKRVKSVSYKEVFGTTYTKEYSTPEIGTSYTYSYDQQGRVAKVIWHNRQTENREKIRTYTFDYRIVGEISMNYEYESVYGSSIDSKDSYTLILSLNDRGNVTKVKDRINETDSLQIKYTQDARLSEVRRKKYDNEDWCEKLYYTDGLLTKYEVLSNTSSVDNDIQEFDVNTLYPHRYPNGGTNIDFNAFLFSLGTSSYEAILMQIGLLGKGSDCLMELTGRDYGKLYSPVPKYQEPGKVHKITKTIIEFPSEYYDINYEFDGDKNVTKFSYTTPYEVYELYYENHVGHELQDPDYPEMGYKFERKNEKKTKLRDEENVCTYTVTYE